MLFSKLEIEKSNSFISRRLTKKSSINMFILYCFSIFVTIPIPILLAIQDYTTHDIAIKILKLQTVSLVCIIFILFKLRHAKSMVIYRFILMYVKIPISFLATTIILFSLITNIQLSNIEINMLTSILLIVFNLDLFLILFIIITLLPNMVLDRQVKKKKL